MNFYIRAFLIMFCVYVCVCMHVHVAPGEAQGEIPTLPPELELLVVGNRTLVLS